MRSFFLILIAAISQPSVARAAYVKVTKEQVCAYDKFCKSALNGDGTVKRPNKVLMKLIEENKDHIFASAEKFGVDPMAVAGAILAENTMNVGVTDAIQDWFAKRGITSVAGKEFSFGIGQINFSAAKAAEAFMAEKEKRPQRTDQEINAKLVTPEGSIEYAAGIVLNSQEAYRKEGIDISERPEILTTLYNLGQPETRAKNSKAMGALPQPNYFGFFVGENLPIIERLLQRQGRKTGEDVFKFVPGQKQLAIEGKLKLYGGVPNCAKSRNVNPYAPSGGQEGGKLYEYQKKSNETSFPEIGEATGRYVVINRNIDCDAEDWALIRDERGETGWVKKERLQAATITVDRMLHQFCDRAEESCVERLKSAHPDNFLAQKDNLVDFAISLPPTADPKQPRSWKSDLNHCLRNAQVTVGGQAQQAVGGQGPAGSVVTLDKKAATQMQKRFQAKKKAVADILGLPSWESPLNPVQGQVFVDLQIPYSCANSCELGPSEKLDAFLDFPVDSITSFAKLQEFSSLGNQLRVSTQQSPMASMVSAAEVKKMFVDSCSSLEKHPDPDTVKKYHALLKDLDDLTAQNKNLPNMGYGFNGSVLEDFIHQNCRRPAETLNTLRGDDLEAKLAACEETSLPYQGLNVNIAILQRLGVQLDEKLVESSSTQVLSMLEGTINAAKSSSNDSNGAPSCSYEPFETLKKVEEIAADPCVDRVLVPDPFLYNSAKEEAKRKLLLTNFPTDDRFSAYVKTHCEEKK